MRVNLPITEVEHPVPEGEILVSKTDRKGIITYCNKIFCEISGFSEQELIGSPHNLIRHPDMPSAMFADLWRSIQAGYPWHGVIKNRCKNGDYYWVEANVTPLIENNLCVGYVSMRYKPTEQQIAIATQYLQAIKAGKPGKLPDSEPNLHYIVFVQQRLAEKIVALEEYHAHFEEEQHMGSHIIEKITHIPSSLAANIRRHSRPAKILGGDILAASLGPTGNTLLLLADAVGHWLSSAINVLPICQIFYSLSATGFSLQQIAAEINKSVHVLMPADRFVSTALVLIDHHNRTIEAWNGGMPALLLFNRNGQLLHRWESNHLPMGILSSEAFSDQTESCQYREDCQLFLYSDGLIEALSPAGAALGIDSITRLLGTTPPGKRFDSLEVQLDKHLAGRAPHDDITFAIADIAVDIDEGRLLTQPDRVRKDRDSEDAANWRIAIQLGATELKYLDINPFIMQIISNIRGVCEHRSSVFLILSELFNNALDHGLLRLDSRIKLDADGFNRYLRLREERLNWLTAGNIAVEIERTEIAGKSGIRIRVADSGDGFDYPAHAANASISGFHGRGIALIRSLAYRLDYFGRGNEAVAMYLLH